MAESSEHTAEDLIPIQNFMRRFSHVDPRDQERSLLAAAEAVAAAEAAKQPTLWQKFKNLFIWTPEPPPRVPTRHDWLLLPLMNAKDWLIDHPKTTTAICTVLFSTVADKMPYYDKFHKWACWCIEDESCVVGFILKRAKLFILCT
ncbi:hypothetical protein KC19_9G172000 [Ceratodon purpureus]|uniref:Uncharacterized protein n=1 Tax=Ceratodon purpureus TaxID=3225 RepID=A0A8T0GWZ7_CERPU|nr:hypothetical protein KC19_9G172000 [Ceratodon purpureus]